MTQVTEPELLVCQQCRKNLRSYFQISKIDANGQRAPKNVRVCSLVCLVQWAYNYGVQQGLHGIGMARNLLESITNTVRGGR